MISSRIWVFWLVLTVGLPDLLKILEYPKTLHKMLTSSKSS